MATLWLPLSAEVELPDPLPLAQREWLARALDPRQEDSLWSQAAGMLGLRSKPEPLLRWRDEVAYVNWSMLVGLVSGGLVEVERPPARETGYRYRRKLTLGGLAKLLKSQWLLEDYLRSRLEADWAPPVVPRDAVRESLALGLALLSLTLRLPAHSPAELARWLAVPGAAPRSARSTLRRLQAIQKLRTVLSPAWKELLGGERALGHARGVNEFAAPFFWEDEVPARAPGAAEVGGGACETAENRLWQGLAVCPGEIEGQARLMPAGASPSATHGIEAGTILVFARARAETVEFFGNAAGIVFIEGGALAHACVIARERGIPCVSGVGPAFRKAVENAGGSPCLRINGATGAVQIMDGLPERST